MSVLPQEGDGTHMHRTALSKSSELAIALATNQLNSALALSCLSIGMYNLSLTTLAQNVDLIEAEARKRK